jgi:HD-GYP domain-containing protein (c-di-GMP phosphodiesterase class II)
MRTERPYRKAFEIQAIIGLMKEVDGKDFNPMLVGNFLKAFKKIVAV